ncbi:hypothetical protein BsWGS_17438 [Bradybaena similaris]
MILFPGGNVNPICGISVISCLLCITTATDINGFTFRYLDKDNTILKLSCDGQMVAAKGANFSITIFDVASMKTLAQMRVGECPWTGHRRAAGKVFTVVCLLHNADPLPILELVLTDVGKSGAPTFGCNITDLTTSMTTFVAWTITAYRNDPPPVTERAAESRLKLMAQTTPQPDNSFSVYAMGFAILSLALGLAAALCYIGMQKLKSRRRCGNLSSDQQNRRYDDNIDVYEDAMGDSESGQDGDRSLFGPNGTFRRPSYQDYSEPVSPVPSEVSNYIGIDFLQIQLSDPPFTAPNVRLPREKFTKKEIKTNSILLDKLSECYRKESIGINMDINAKGILNCNKNIEVKRGCSECLLDSTIVVLEYTTTEILDISDDDDVRSFLRNYI